MLQNVLVDQTNWWNNQVSIHTWTICSFFLLTLICFHSETFLKKHCLEFGPFCTRTHWQELQTIVLVTGWQIHTWFMNCSLPVGVFPIWKVYNYDLWRPGSVDILWVHNLWHWQLDKAVLLWWVHLGICCALSGYYQSLLESSHHFQSIWIMEFPSTQQLMILNSLKCCCNCGCLVRQVLIFHFLGCMVCKFETHSRFSFVCIYLSFLKMPCCYLNPHKLTTSFESRQSKYIRFESHVDAGMCNLSEFRC